MKKTAYISFTIFILLLGCTLHTAWSDDLLTRDQAISILMEQVIDSSINKDTLMAFGPQEMLTAGDVVKPMFLNTEPYNGSATTIQSPTWFFWIDDKPNPCFVHPCRFVFIAADNPNATIGDGITVEIQGWWPKINGVDYYEVYEERIQSQDMVYGEALEPCM